MCGRYALGIRASFVRDQFEDHGMPVAEAPDDDDTRQTYNFAPGSYGLVYRADVSDHGAGNRHRRQHHDHEDEAPEDERPTEAVVSPPVEEPKETKYKLQAMKWGLVPFWTKRNPDYGSIMKAINARDDSLKGNGGMWATMKKSKRCIVVAQGFYEWLKKNGGKEKIPHYTKRTDGQLLCFAGLWDCVQYEGSEEKHFTYTIITTDSNKQLSFLHDRMPVILENGSDQIRLWLDPARSEWSQELQSLLKPYDQELDCYPVSKEVGKVGNNSPAFIVPVASSDNKNNIANFFSRGEKKAKGDESHIAAVAEEVEVKTKGTNVRMEQRAGDQRTTVDHDGGEDNAPRPVPASPPAKSIGLKRKHAAEHEDSKASDQSVRPGAASLPTASPEKTPAKKSRSATSNGSKGKLSQASTGSKNIAGYFHH